MLQNISKELDYDENENQVKVNSDFKELAKKYLQSKILQYIY